MNYPILNNNKPQNWKQDQNDSVDTYNNWFLLFAPKAFKNTRNATANDVQNCFKATNNLTLLTSTIIKNNPKFLSILRMSTCPPLARDRLSGMTHTPKSFITSLEKGMLPKKDLDKNINIICSFITKMLDDDLIQWIKNKTTPTQSEINRASVVIADRLVGTMTNPIIRNTQEEKQLSKLKALLNKNGYSIVSKQPIGNLKRGEYAIHINVPTNVNGKKKVNVSVDLAFIPKSNNFNDTPILIEAKSAGDFTNVNKRRKEEATKMSQLRSKYPKVKYILLLTGYFDTGYLGYEAAEGIDWIWEHRLNDIMPLIV